MNIISHFIDLLRKGIRIPIRRAREIIGQVGQAISEGLRFAAEAGGDVARAKEIGRLHRRFPT